VRAIAPRPARLKDRLVPREDHESERLREWLRKRREKSDHGFPTAAAYQQRAPLDRGRHSALRAHSQGCQ
jgi:hypothetical protein